MTRYHGYVDALEKLLSDKKCFYGIDGRTSGEYEIIVIVVDLTSAALAKVPAVWEGFPVRTHIEGIPTKF